MTIPGPGPARALLRPLAALAERSGRGFYVVLALAVILVAALLLSANLMRGMKHQAYDLIMKYRLIAPPADPQIVILDIDEASLATLAPDYGRWPWPRSVMAETVEGLVAQGVRAIVFDITFSDADVFNVEADGYFRATIATHPQTYFPMIRLNPDNDSLSKLRLDGLAGVNRADPAASTQATAAMVVPYLYPVLDGARLGTNNLYADEDGIVRSYHVYRDAHGWRIGSLPANVVRGLGGTLPARPDVLINWRGRPVVYRTLPFHDVYTDLLRQQHQRPADEFRDKIVIIGSTAPSLFDLKPTPMARIHPGVEILATALDNMRRGDWLTELPAWFYLLVTATSIALLAWAFAANIDHRVLTPVFTALQLGFLGVTYLFVNISTLFVDLTAPFTFSLAYFFVARLRHTLVTLRRGGHPLFADTLDSGRDCLVAMLHCRIEAPARSARRHMRLAIGRLAGASRHAVAPPALFDTTPYLHDIFRKDRLVYWLAAAGAEGAVLGDAARLLGRLDTAVTTAKATGVSASLHAVVLHIDGDGRWRVAGQRALAELLAMGQEAAVSDRLQVLVSPAARSLLTQYDLPVPAISTAGLAQTGANPHHSG